LSDKKSIDLNSDLNRIDLNRPTLLLIPDMAQNRNKLWELVNKNGPRHEVIQNLTESDQLDLWNYTEVKKKSALEMQPVSKLGFRM